MPQIYAFGKATEVPNKYAFYDMFNSVAGKVDPNQAVREFSNNPFGVSAEELRSMSTKGAWATGGGDGGGGGSGSGAVLDRAAIDNTQKALNSLGIEYDTGIRSVDDSFRALTGKYDLERERNKGEFDTSTVTNTQNLTKNKSNALLSASQGLRGLRGTLASLGALSGTGGELASRAVTEGANKDIGGAVDTYAENAQGLDKAWKRFDEEDQERRAEAETTRGNQRMAVEGNVLTKQQQFYQKMAELFASGGNTGEASRYLNMAGDLNAGIAKAGGISASPFVAKAAAFTPGDLASYLAGAGDMTVAVDPNAPGMPGGGVFAGPRRKREEELAPVAA